MNQASGRVVSSVSGKLHRKNVCTDVGKITSEHAFWGLVGFGPLMYLQAEEGGFVCVFFL